MKDAAQIVNMLLETQDLRVCPYCDREHNIPVAPGQGKSHGITCKKHMEHHLNYMTGGDPVEMERFRQFYAKQPDHAFPPEYVPPAAPVAQ